MGKVLLVDDNYCFDHNMQIVEICNQQQVNIKFTAQDIVPAVA